MAKELLQTPELSSLSRIAAQVSIGSWILFATLLLSLHIIRPELDPTWSFISEYALGKNGWIMTITFTSLASGMLFLLVAIRTQVRTVIGYIGMALQLISFVGIIIAAIFPTDPISTPPDALTESGKLHMMGASLDWTPFAALFLSLSLCRTKLWAGMKKKLLVAAAITILLTIAFIAAAASVPNNQFGPGTYAGVVGRILLLSYLGWFLPVGFHVIKLTKQSTRSVFSIS